MTDALDEVPVDVHADRLTCPDGLEMALDVYRPAAPGGELPGVVICHGFKGFRTWGMFPHLARRLAATGRAVALFDFSHNGVGEEDGEFTRLDLFEKQTVRRHLADLGTVLDHLTDDAFHERFGTEPGRVWAVGHSMGGGVAMMRASDDLRIAGLACLNAVSHFDRVPAEMLGELDTVGHVTIPNARTGQQMPLGRAWFDDIASIDLAAVADEVAVPTLLLQGSEDTTVIPDEGEKLADWIPGNVYFEVPGGDHTFGAKHPWAGWTPALEFVVEQLDAFVPACEASGP